MIPRLLWESLYQIIFLSITIYWAFQVALAVKNPPANAGDTIDADSIPGLGRSFGVGNGKSFQYSCPENSMDIGAWQAIVHAAVKSWT